MKQKIELEELDPQHWRPAYIFPDEYLVSNQGEVYSIRSKRLLNCRIGKQGYRYYVFSVAGERHTVKAHKLVATAFIPNPDNKPAIDHINGNKLDNREKNLRWATFKENNNNPNTIPNYRNGIKALNKPVAVYKKGELIGIYESRKAAAKIAGVEPQTVSQCINKRRKTTQARGYSFYETVDNI